MKLSIPRPGCSKLMKLLVNVSLKCQRLISEMYQYFLLIKMFEAFVLQNLLSFLSRLRSRSETCIAFPVSSWAAVT